MPIIAKQQTIPSYQEWKDRYYAERKRKAEDSRVERLRRGDYAGRLPRGYRWERSESGDEASIVVDAEWAPAVERAFEAARRNDASVRTVLAVLGKEYPNLPLNPATLWRILTNPFYAGLIEHQARLYPGRHPALVSRTAFDRVQANLRRRRKRE